VKKKRTRWRKEDEINKIFSSTRGIIIVVRWEMYKWKIAQAASNHPIVIAIIILSRHESGISKGAIVPG